MAAVFEKTFIQDLTGRLIVRYCPEIVFSNDNLSNQINVNLYVGPNEYAGGGTVTATVIRSDGNTVPVSGSISGNVASVTLIEACMDVPGQIQVFIRLTSGNVKTTIFAGVFTAIRTETDTIIDPGTIIPSITELINQIDAAIDSIPADYSTLLGSVAGTYSASKTYAVGDYVWYGGALYRCTTAISTAESWTAAHWTAAVLGNDVTSLNSALYELNSLKTFLFEQGGLSAVAVGQPLRLADTPNTIRSIDFADWQAGLSMSLKNGYQARLLLCDSDGNYIVDVPWAQTVTSNNSVATKVKVTIRKSDNSAITPDKAVDAVSSSTIKVAMVEEKANEVEVTALAAQIEDKTDKIETALPQSYVLQDIQSETGVMYTTGEVNTEAGQRKSISVYPGEKYKVITYKYSSSYPGYLFFFNGGLVSYVNTQTANAVFTEEITIPDNVDTMVVNGNLKNCDVFKLTLLNISTLFKGSFAYYYKKQDFTENIGILDRWNNVVAGTGCRCIISVEPGEEYRLFGYKWGSDYAGYYLMNQEGAIMSYDNSTPTGVNRYWDVTIPEGISELVLNSVSANVGIYKKVYTGAKPYSNWVGKKIAWFGTSIPENSNYIPFGGYPGYVGDLLGATVYNEAVGSSTARRGFMSAISENDPWGVTNMGVAALWSMGATIEEKQELIANWETKWRAVTGYDVAMTDTIRNKALACCYENKLVQKYIVENPVDLYVFDHGYNDYRNNATDLSADPNDFYNRSTFQGAMATFIKAILEANPRANIVLVSHYESQRCPGLIGMQNDVAEDWNLPFVRLDNQLGWAYNRTISVKGHWNSSGYWVEGDETVQTLRLTEVHMLDGKHPNTDRSGKACMQIGAILAEAINKIHPN